MMNYLVDVPVKVCIWIREDAQRKQFEVIQQAKPSVLFIQSDGGRNSSEWEAINRGRDLYENVDWECKIYRIYANENLGMYRMGAWADEVIWSHVDRCILLEDDCIPCVSFFKFCEVLLEQYKNDERIELICGMNTLEKCESVSSDYFFSKGGSIWGFATWKRVYDGFDKARAYAKDQYIMDRLETLTKSNSAFYQQVIGYSKTDRYMGHIPWYEFYFALDLYANHRLNIIPKYNMISCCGCTENSAHSSSLERLPKVLRKIFEMKTYDLSFPLKDPVFVIDDENYYLRVQEIIQGKNALDRAKRHIESAYLNIKKDGLNKWINKHLKKKNRIEN